MKKIIAVLLCCLSIISLTACTSNKTQNTNPSETKAKTLSSAQKEKLSKKLDSFEGIFYFVEGNEVLYSHTKGKDDKSNDLTLQTPMYIGSVSKQFCATAIMMLKEQGKLDVLDTLDKYFPEYSQGKDITIKNLLTMRSGIAEMIQLEGLDYYEKVSPDKTESENCEIVKKWIFSQPLEFEPDTTYKYCNTNYFLLSEIVEIVSQKPYCEFIRENIFKPLNMEHTGFVCEIDDNEYFSNSLSYVTISDNLTNLDGLLDGLLCKGAGDIVTTAPDMDKWMTGLLTKQLISEKSYREMTTDYSSDSGMIYGYGLMGMYNKGFGHSGIIGNYMATDYFNEEYNIKIFAVTQKSHSKINSIVSDVMSIYLNG